jgi:hypothetical protein
MTSSFSGCDVTGAATCGGAIYLLANTLLFDSICVDHCCANDGSFLYCASIPQGTMTSPSPVNGVSLLECGVSASRWNYVISFRNYYSIELTDSNYTSCQSVDGVGVAVGFSSGSTCSMTHMQAINCIGDDIVYYAGSAMPHLMYSNFVDNEVDSDGGIMWGEQAGLFMEHVVFRGNSGPQLGLGFATPLDLKFSFADCVFDQAPPASCYSSSVGLLIQSNPQTIVVPVHDHGLCAQCPPPTGSPPATNTHQFSASPGNFAVRRRYRVLSSWIFSFPTF